MAAALKFNCDRMEENAERLEDLELTLRDGIEQIAKSAVFLGEGVGLRLPGFVSVSFPGHSAEGMLHLLDLKGIAVSTGAACDSRNTQVSHVLKAINAPRAIAESTLRISLGIENTRQDVAAILAALKSALRLSAAADAAS